MEGSSEDGREREGVVEAASLDFPIQGGATAQRRLFRGGTAIGQGGRGHDTAAEIKQTCEAKRVPRRFAGEGGWFER